MNKKIIFSLVLAVSVFFVFHGIKSNAALVGTTSQATLSLSPATGSYAANNNFTLSIYLNTRGQNTDTVAVFLKYSTAYFQAVSIDSAGSAFTMQAIQDTTTPGVVNIVRMIPAPGYVNSASALVAAVTFKGIANTAPTSDNFTFDFTVGDANKTNVFLAGSPVLSGVYNGQYTISGGSNATPTPTPVSTPTPSKTPTPTPSVSSTPTPSVTPPPGGWGPGNRPRPSQFSIREGDTVSAPGSNDPDVYIVNDAGFKRLFLNPVIFGFYGHLGGFRWVRPIVATTRDAFETSSFFRNCETNDPKVYAVQVTGEDTGTLHWVDITGNQAIAQDGEFFSKVFCINNNEFNWYTSNGSNFGSTYTSLSQVPVYKRQ